jgi:NADPH:quinone reductase-like Zn-dependent oxidoreductase
MHRMPTPLLALLAWVLAATTHAAAPPAMLAVVQMGTGGPDVLQLRNVPRLEPGRQQVSIRVYAAGVNPLDWKGRVGYAPPPRPGETAPAPAAPAAESFAPRIPGSDVAGIIAAVGPGVDRALIGSEVFARLTRNGVAGLNGGYAEYAVANLSDVVPMPKNITFAQAAGLGTVALTGMRAIVQANVTRGQRVLILGVAGGVGSSAAQAAKARGAYVIGTATARHNDYLRAIGVDEVIDYSQVRFEQQVRDVDVVLDTVGGADTTLALRTMRRGGMLISWVSSADAAACRAAGVRCPSGRGNGPGAAAAFTESELLGQVAQLVEQGRFIVHVDRSFPLQQAGEAQEFSRDGHVEGKVILLVDAAAAARTAGSATTRTAVESCTACPQMVTVPPGSFLMGGTVRITLPRALQVSRTEITFAQWDACIADGGCEFVPEDSGWGRGDRAVMGVSWDDVQQYLTWLSRRTGHPYRLLSDAEWEYAARAGTRTAYFWGDSDADICRYASVDSGGDACGAVRPTAVASHRPNAWGLYDMSGSMWEWVQDCWSDNLRRVPRDATPLVTSPCRWRGMRGGSWNFTPDYARSDSRSYSAPSIRYDSYGFRVATSTADR